jgi:hypothetical protein
MWQFTQNPRYSSEDADYFARRALEEDAAARRATCRAARERHEELAAMYRFRAGAVSARPADDDARVEDAQATIWL